MRLSGAGRQFLALFHWVVGERGEHGRPRLRRGPPNDKKLSLTSMIDASRQITIPIQTRALPGPDRDALRQLATRQQRRKFRR